MRSIKRLSTREIAIIVCARVNKGWAFKDSYTAAQYQEEENKYIKEAEANKNIFVIKYSDYLY